MKRVVIAATVLVVGIGIVLMVLMNTVWLGSSGPETGTKTKWVRVDPWSDPEVAGRPAAQDFPGTCVIDAARDDRASCEGDQECYLNVDATKVACGDPLIVSWTVWKFTPASALRRTSTTPPVLVAIALRLTNGDACHLEWRRADNSTDGWTWSAGYCTEENGDSYPFWARDVDGPLSLGYLYEPSGSGYLRVAVRSLSSDDPEYEDVAELYY